MRFIHDAAGGRSLMIRMGRSGGGNNMYMLYCTQRAGRLHERQNKPRPKDMKYTTNVHKTKRSGRTGKPQTATNLARQRGKGSGLEHIIDRHNVQDRNEKQEIARYILHTQIQSTTRFIGITRCLVFQCDIERYTVQGEKHSHWDGRAQCTVRRRQK